jgi:drug/metabolite transporter (DMT)-like permease
MTPLILLIAVIISGTSGELCLARAMRSIGEVSDFHPSALVHMLARVVGVPWIWLALALFAIDVVALLALLSVEDVSFAIPMTALSYVVGAIGGASFLGEHVHRQRWLGVLLVCGGVALVYAGGR